MPTFTAREVRTWAAANDVDCPRVGRVPQHVIDAYLLDVHGVTITDAVDQVEETGWAVTVSIPGDVDTDVVDAISGHVLEAVYAAYYAGRSAERALILNQLQEA